MRFSLSATIMMLGCASTLWAATLIIKHDGSFDPDRLRQELQLPGEGRPALTGVAPGNPRGLDRVLRWELPEGEPAAKWIAHLERLRQIEYAETIPLRRTFDWPDDGDGLYALELVQAAAAWDLSHGDLAVVIGVLDIGTDWQHEDLEGNLYLNEAEANGTPGEDDDGNGFIDDIRGWDFFEGDNDPDPGNPAYTHGTHVAGTASAVTDNGTGVAAIAWNCSYMPVRVGIGSTIYNGYEGIHYAAHNGAHIINLSWGGSNYSAFEQDVCQDALDQGVVLVAAAGNNNSNEPHYPAAYYGVIAVANVNAEDLKSGSSCWGTWIDVCAPGVSINSTLPNDNYGQLSGTSMAAPQVASLLGLLKSYRPGWSGLQIMQQVIFTADPIDDLNPGYEGLLGSGRINAATALGEMVTAIRLSDVQLEDASGDGILDPGETVDLLATLTNHLSPISDYSCVLSCDDIYIDITSAAFSGGALATGEEAVGELQFEIDAAAPNGHPFQLAFEVTANGGGFAITEYRRYVVLPVYGDHDNGNCRLTVSSLGALGYYDNEESQAVGSGFQYPIGATNSLWHGSFLVGYDGEHVSDCATWNQPTVPYDFTTAPGGELAITTSGDLQESITVFNDAINPNALPVEVLLHGMSLATGPASNGVILTYRLLNTGTTTLNGVQAALWMDFDCMGTWDNDYAGYDADAGLGFQHDEGSIWVGMGILSHDAASFRAVDNFSWVNNGFTDSEKYGFMTEGFVVTNPANTNDWSLFQSAPLADLEPGGQHTVAWAVLGGDDFNDLLANFNELYEYNLQHSPELPAAVPQDWQLERLYPNPFNPATTLVLSTPAPRRFSLEVFNILGEQVYRSSPQLAAGSHQLTLDLAGQPTGVYLLRLSADRRSLTRKLMLVK